MINEDEAFWAGIAVAVMMLGGGFSMLFLNTFTGFGAVVLALGLMTMALTIQMRAKPVEYVTPALYESNTLPSPTPPIGSAKEVVEPEPTAEPKSEPATEQPSDESAQPEPAEEPQPTNAEPTPPIEKPAPEPPQTQQPAQPQAPIEETTQPPKTEEEPKEEPQVVPPAS